MLPLSCIVIDNILNITSADHLVMGKKCYVDCISIQTYGYQIY